MDGTAAGFAQFMDSGDQRIFFHTEVSEKFSGQGLAGTLPSRPWSRPVPRGSGSSRCAYVAKFVENSDQSSDVVDKLTPVILELVSKTDN